VALAGLCAPAVAYPDRPVRIIVPNAAGGGTDLNARLIAKPLEKALGKPVAVVNVVGAGTSLGARQVKDAAPDGHTVLFIHQALLAAGAMKVADFGPDAFEVVAQTGVEYYVMMVNAASPLRTFKDAVEAAKAKPETMRFGGQIGALNHFSALDLADRTSVKFRFVNSGGGGPTRTALLGNHVDIAYATVGEVKSFVEAGELRLLCVFAPERLPSLPNVPTAREGGYDIVQDVRYWWWMPKSVPADRVAAFTGALQAAMRDPEVIDRLKATEIAPVVATGPDVQRGVEQTFAAMQRLASSAGVN
jgi:tripartite-type tricarboxylate transporter receptor subunit TctC